MEAARFERTTVDIDSADGAGRPARHRPGRHLRRLSQGLHGGPRRRRSSSPTTRTTRRLPQIVAGRARRQARRHPRAALHPAAAALHRGDAGQAHGGARHRPALDLRLDRLDDPGARLRAQGQEPPLPRGQGPPRHRVPRSTTSAATSTTTSPPTSRATSTASPPATRTGRSCSPASGSDFSAALGETEGLRITEVLEKINEVLEPHLFPVTPEDPEPRRCKVCGTGRLSLAHRALGRRLHRLLELPRMPLHPPARRRGRGRRGRRPRRQAARPRRRRRCPVTLRVGPYGLYVQLGEASRGRPEAEARLDPQGHGRRAPSTSSARSTCWRCRG